MASEGLGGNCNLATTTPEEQFIPQSSLESAIPVETRSKQVHSFGGDPFPAAAHLRKLHRNYSDFQLA